MTIYTVSDATQLQSALGRAVGGDRIFLQGGNYGTVTLSNRSYASNVTIQSASTTNRAHFDGLSIAGSKNLYLSGLDLGHALKAGETAGSTVLNGIYDSNGIHLVNSTIHGSLDGNPANDGNGLLVRGTTNFVMSGVTFQELNWGSFVQRSSNVTIANSTYKNIRVDGADFAAVDNVTLDGNTFSDFHWLAGDHPDAVQFWNTNETRGSTNITIKNNVVMPGAGSGTQGIWISDAGAYGYKNVVIQNNLLYSNDLYNGLSVMGGTGVQILGNTVLSNSKDNKEFWIRLNDSSNVVVKDNVTDAVMVLTGNSGVTQTHNLDLSANPAAKSLFANLNLPTNVQDLIVADYGYHALGTVRTSAAVSAVPLDTGAAATVTSASVEKVAIPLSTVQPVAAPAAIVQPTSFAAPASHDVIAPSPATLAELTPTATFRGHLSNHLHFDHFALA